MRRLEISQPVMQHRKVEIHDSPKHDIAILGKALQGFVEILDGQRVLTSMEVHQTTVVVCSSQRVVFDFRATGLTTQKLDDFCSATSKWLIKSIEVRKVAVEKLPVASEVFSTYREMFVGLACGVGDEAVEVA